ncbi:MAG TPA: hypothetical protein VN718_06460 [Rhizomicrobium sp.]|nr:hypothetical protein [Rhizomicrobium sp.]
MQNNDLMSELLARDHAGLSARLARKPMDRIVLAQLQDRDRFRGLVLATAGFLGAGVAAAEIVALVPASKLWPGVTQLGFAMTFLLIAGMIGILGRAMAD